MSYQPPTLPPYQGSPTIPSAYNCLSHLTLLETFNLLRHQIANHDNLFNISNSMADDFPDKTKPLAKIAEKRWEIYLVRAEDRFRKWYQTIPKHQMITQKQIISNPSRFSDIHSPRPIPFNFENLPPLDVLMVWHAYMLNPRNYLSDCIRNGMKYFWQIGLPWGLINSCIVDFVYDPNSVIKTNFETQTGLKWDNLDDPNKQQLHCPQCHSLIEVPWTCGSIGDDLSKPFHNCTGYGDREFFTICSNCNFHINHETLRVQKFRKDIEILIKNDIPMLGTLLNYRGQPITYPFGYSFDDTFISNKIITAKLGSFLELTDPKNPNIKDTSISSICELFEKLIRDKKLLKSVTLITDLLPCRVLIRQMMVSYWGNSSPFSLDLVGAVIRQGIFIQKMHQLDWLHSPAINSTIDNLLIKYERFIKLIQKYTSSTTVPTLDIDLAWHTHQLQPASYYEYCDKMTQSFINHDDKIEECKLSEAFERTSKRYEKMFNEPYSSCLCWYCEAVREITRTKLLKSKIDPQEFNKMDPNTCPHISAHNAIKIIASDSVKKAYAKRKEAKSLQLRKAYESASIRAKKKGRYFPKKYSSDPYFNHWGYTTPAPIGHAPYMEYPEFEGDFIYPSNPLCMSSDIGQNGNCVGCGGGCFGNGCGGGGCSGGGCGGGD